MKALREFAPDKFCQKFALFYGCISYPCICLGICIGTCPGICLGICLGIKTIPINLNQALCRYCKNHFWLRNDNYHINYSCNRDICFRLTIYTCICLQKIYVWYCTTVAIILHLRNVDNITKHFVTHFQSFSLKLVSSSTAFESIRFVAAVVSESASFNSDVRGLDPVVVCRHLSTQVTRMRTAQFANSLWKIKVTRSPLSIQSPLLDLSLTIFSLTFSLSCVVVLLFRLFYFKYFAAQSVRM